ncbi:hypothetical protein [Sebaldella termitidis]|uniref:hypothetical protein n=1 Tax=Sebaldella termitidis TaxID=826 RepID=UPI003EB6F7FA
MKSLKERTEDFWKLFSEKESEIRSLMDENKIMERFSDIDSMFEIDMPFMMGKSSTENKYELIFNPAGLKSRYFIADYFKRKMPVELKKKWNFYDMKPAMGIKNMRLLINDENFYEEDFSVLIKNIDAERKRVDILVLCPKFFGQKKVFEENEMYNVIYNIMDALLGEGIVESYLGMIKIEDIESSPEETLTLREFSIKMDEISEENSWIKNPKILDRYNTYRCDIENIEDLRAVRNDIVVGFSSNMAVVEEYAEENNEYNFMSGQGGIYGMLFYDNSEVPNEEKIPLRDKLESILAELPEYGDIFEIFGAATGLYKSYIDIIIYDYDLFGIILEKLEIGKEFPELFYKDFKVGSEIRKIVSISGMVS